MTAYNHFTYGASLVNTLKLYSPSKTKSFHKATNSDSLGSISERLSAINYPVLVAIDGRDADFHDNGSEALIKKPQYFFMLLAPAPNDNNEKILTVQAEMEANALQIQARLITDYIDDLNGLSGLLIDSFTVRGIGPVSDSLYGVIIAFNIEYGIGTKINETYWVTPNP